MAELSYSTSFQRGETFVIALEAVQGDISGATVRAVLKAASNGEPPGDAASEAAVFSSSSVAHVDADDLTSKPGWLLSLTATQTAGLALGLYLMDARIVLASGAIDQTGLVAVTVRERITQAP